MKCLKKIGAVAISAVVVTGMMSGAGSISYAAEKLEKQETVYVNQKADGSVDNITVSDWLKNISGTGNVTDASNLDNIKNVKGDESFQQEKDGKLVWSANNADIYYQGTTNETLPVGVHISYKLDGVATDAKEMAGKSGKLTITLQYENNMNGENEEQSIPFLMTSAMILPVDTFHNVTVSQGKIISEGSNQILVAYGMPGLEEELKLSGDMKEKLDKKIGDTVTITADVTDFSMGSIYTVASSNVFSDIDLDADGNMDDLENAIDGLVSATDELISGSKELSEGLTTLQSSFKTYAAGVNSVGKGASDLATGASDLKKGITKYTKGVKSLTDGTGQYITGTQSLAEGVSSYVAGEKLIDSGIAELYTKTKDFPAQYGAFSKGLQDYIDGVDRIANKDNADALVKGTSAVKGGIQDLHSNLVKMNAGCAQYGAIIDMLEQLKNQQPGMAEQINAAISLLQAQRDGMAEMVQATGEGSPLASGADQLAGAMQQLGDNAGVLTQGGQSLKNYNSQISEGITGISGGISSLYTGIQQLSASNEALLAGATQLQTKSTDLITGIGQITKSSALLNSSVATLSKGANKLSKGTGSLESATKDVGIGVDKLQTGSISLLNGMNQFKAEGTGKLQNEYDNNIKTVIERFRSLTVGAKEYKTFSGVADGMDGEVQFIFETEEISSK